MVWDIGQDLNYTSIWISTFQNSKKDFFWHIVVLFRVSKRT